ncbi:hypothetical protein, partial [Fischerella thermalis]|uniref:hypothetical protein n=1 Tax=Fischerella thermalis TaxID=372787 RepID=UPI00307F4305
MSIPILTFPSNRLLLLCLQEVQDLRNWHKRSLNFSTDVLNNDATSTGRSPTNSILVLQKCTEN